MGAAIPEFRKPVMTRVEASWEDSGGARQTILARMEDKSAGGACIRVKTPIGVGAKLRIQWRFENFSGTARYCRSDGKEYLVGIQRDLPESPNPTQAVPATAVPQKAPPQKVLTSGGIPVSIINTQSLPPESKPSGVSEAGRSAESFPTRHVADATIAIHAAGLGHEDRNHHLDDWRRPRPPDSRALQPTAIPTQQPAERAAKERKTMARKWLEL